MSIMNNIIANKTLDDIDIIWDNIDKKARVLNCSPQLRVISDFFSRTQWSTLMYIAQAVRDEENMGINGSGFRYAHNELDPDEEPFEGVEIYDPLGELYLTPAAFDRLMNRFFSALRDGAIKQQAQIVQQSWWRNFIKNAKYVEKRVKNRGSSDEKVSRYSKQATQLLPLWTEMPLVLTAPQIERQIAAGG